MDFMSRAWGPQIYHECLYDALKQETNCSEVAGCQGVTRMYQARSHSEGWSLCIQVPCLGNLGL